MNTKILRRAINSGDAKQVAELLRESPLKDVHLANGWRPIHVAVRRGHKHVVAAMIETGVDLNGTTDMHETPLDLAIRLKQTTIAELLEKKGARSGANMSLHAATAAGDLKAVKKHIQAGVDINELVKGEVPLCIALHYRRWDVAKYLLNKKCDVTTMQQWNQTPLHVAAESGAPSPVRRDQFLNCS
jgi:ankyrin repeat protein